MEVNNNICKAVNKRNEHSSTWLNINNIKHYVIPMLLAAVCYSNSLKGEFVHDDIFAIKNNPDANGKSSLSDVWKNDFWGKSIVDFTSHKSYRPITTLTFRLNYVLSGGQPFTFHVVNVLLHCTVTGLFIYLLRQIFNISNQCIFYSSVLFAVHPIHTEAVAGIVGRADVLAAVFFLSAIILYVRSVEKLEYKEDDDIPITIRPVYLFTSILCAIICTLCKEHGIMVLIVCAAVDCLILSKKAVNRILSGELSILHSKPLFIRIVLLAISFLLVFIIRFLINGGQVPTFLEQDNPASFSSSFLTRVLTYNYLLAFNLWLLFTPITLCYDWQIGSIPLIESFQDQRNLATILFYLLLLFVIRRCFKVFREKDCCNNVVIIATIFMCLPFIPASNLFLKVGFVVAERILYIPSLGFCLLIGSGLTSLQSRLYRYRWVLYSIFSIYTIILASKTLHRNQVWQSRQSLFWSGVVTLPHNAKVHYNYGNYLKDTGNTSEAILHYREALSLYPVHASVHNNLGTLLTNQSEAEYHFKEARKYNSRHKGALVNLANIYYSKHQNELAESLINQALKIDPAYHLALMAFSKVLMETGRTEKAKKYIDAALQTEPHSADTHNYHGAYLHRTGKYSEAVSSYLTAYSLNNRDLSSVTNAASTLNTLGRVSEAEDLLKRALTVSPNVELKNQLGLLYYSSNNVSKSLTIYRNILKNAPNYTDAATNYAKILVSIDNLEEATSVIDNVLNQAPDNVDALQVKASVLVKKGEKTEAIQYLEFALQQSTSHIEDNDRLTTITFHLGALYQELKDLKTALRYFQNVIKIDPNHSKAHLHIGGIHHINNNFSIARKHYNEVLRLDPSNTFAKKNLEKLGRLEKKAKTVK